MNSNQHNSKAIDSKLGGHSKSISIDVFLAMTSSFLGTLGALWYWGFSPSNFHKLIRVPFFGDGDEILYMVTSRSFMTTGKLTNSIYSFPTYQDLNYAYFSVDSLAPLTAGYFGRFFGDLVVGVNVYYLFGFALTGLMSYFACRILRIRKIVSLFCSAAMNFLPMHLTGGTMSLTLTSIALIPVVSAICLRQLGKFPVIKLKELFRGGNLEKLQQLSFIVLLLIFGASYSYHAAMILLIFGSVYVIKLLSSELVNRIALPLALMSVFFGFLLAAIPALIAFYSESGGKYLEARSWSASLHTTGYPGQFFVPYVNTLADRILTGVFDWYPEKIAALRILPTRGYFGEGEIYSLSLFVIIPAATAYFLSKKKFHILSSDIYEKRTLSTIYQTTFFTFLWSIIGGLGVMFSLFISPILRGYSRFMVLAPILLVFASGLYISERINSKTSLSKKSNGDLIKSSPRTLTLLLLTSLFFSSVDSLAISYGRDRSLRPITALTQRESMNILSTNLLANGAVSGCGILQMPIVHYPYEQPGYPLYRLLVPGLYEDRFRWSSGATQASKGWTSLSVYRKMQDETNLEIFKRALEGDFCAVLIDKTAWERSFSFVPYQDYIPVPPISFDAYLQKVSSMRDIIVNDIETPYGEYVIITLEK